MSAIITPGSFVAGFATGLRTFLPLTVTLAASESPWTGLTGTLAAGELIADKLPGTPARTAPIGLVGRLAFGALCGSLVAGRKNASRPGGAVLGLLGGLTGSYVGYNIRRAVCAEFSAPDPVVALVEDAVTFGLARYANA